VRGSARTRWDLAPTPWAAKLEKMRSAGVRLFDLTASNPTRCGFTYDADAILAPLLNPAAIEYEPDPKGLRSAREAVSLYYRDHSAAVDPDQIFLTTSTSEAYSFLFRLLCDPGDEVLIGQPGYPLFDFLAQLDDVRLVPYTLFYDGRWHLDLEAMHRRITPRTRAIAIVHPNNPTGHFTHRDQRAAIEELCLRHNLALIVDEVFLDYGLNGQQDQSFATGPHPVPTFVLSGLSKVAALPQMKAAWIACFAPALERLEIISDTFLSMSAPIQLAIPAWLQQRGSIQRQIRERVEGNLKTLDTILLRQSLISRLEVEAGWYAVLRVPGVQRQEQMALDLLDQRAVVVHTGGFFGFSGRGWLIVSLLGQQEDLNKGIQALVGHFEGHS
jgi:alanine-synthesizing transaminase